MERSGKTGAKETSLPEKALDYYKHHTQNDNLSRYFCGSGQKLDEWHSVSIDIPKIVVDDVAVKNPSPTSSVASNKKLEWDNGADIGYANCQDRSIQKSASLPILNISGIDRPSDSECATSEDEKRLSDTPRTELLRFISRKVGAPIAESTPYERRSDPILHEDEKPKGKLGVAVFNFEVKPGDNLEEIGRKSKDDFADGTLQYFERYREIKQKNLCLTKPSYVECTGAANISVGIQTSSSIPQQQKSGVDVTNRASTLASSPPEQRQKNVAVEVVSKASVSSSPPLEPMQKNASIGLKKKGSTSSSSSTPSEQRQKNAGAEAIGRASVSTSSPLEQMQNYATLGFKNRESTSASSSPPEKNISKGLINRESTSSSSPPAEQKQFVTSTSTNSDAVVSSSKSFEYVLGTSKVGSAEVDLTEDALSSNSEQYLTELLSKCSTSADAAEIERNLKLLQKLLKSKKYDELTKRYYIKKILKSMVTSTSDTSSEKVTPKLQSKAGPPKSVRTTSYAAPSGEIKYTAYTVPKDDVEVRYRTRDYTASSSSSPNELFVPKSVMPDKSWKHDKTLSEVLLERKCAGDADIVLNYAKHERDAQLSWINTEIEHLTKLRTILEKNSAPKVGGRKKSTTVYMVTTERPSNSRPAGKSKLLDASVPKKTNDNNKGANFPGNEYYVKGETVVNISECGCKGARSSKTSDGDKGYEHIARTKATNTPYVGEDSRESSVQENRMGSIVSRESEVIESVRCTEECTCAEQGVKGAVSSLGPSRVPEHFRVSEDTLNEQVNVAGQRVSEDVRTDKGRRSSQSKSSGGSSRISDSKVSRDKVVSVTTERSRVSGDIQRPKVSAGNAVQASEGVHFSQDLEVSENAIRAVKEFPEYVEFGLRTMEENRECRKTPSHSTSSSEQPRTCIDERRDTFVTRGNSSNASGETSNYEERKRGTSNVGSRDSKDPRQEAFTTRGSYMPTTDKSVGTINEDLQPAASNEGRTFSTDKSVGTIDAQQSVGVDQPKKVSEEVQPAVDSKSQSDVYVNEAVVVANEIVCKAHDGGPVRRIVVEVPMKSSKSCKCYKESGGAGTSITPSSSSSGSGGSFSSSYTNMPLCACCRKCIAVSETSFDLNYINSTTNPPPVFCGPCKAVSQNKVLDLKNPYFNQPSHICNCHDQTGNLSKIQNMLAELQQLEQTEEHCKYRYSKQHKKTYSKAKKKSHKPIAYLLTFDGKENPGPDGLRNEQPREEIRIQLPSMKRSDEPIVEAGSVENYKKRRKSKNLQDYLESNKPDFIKAAEARRKCMIELAYLREQRCQKYKQLLAMTGGFPCSNSPNANTQQKRLFTTKEMKRITAKNYKRLPEVQQKLLDNRNNQIKKANRLLADMFNKKLRDSVLKGKPSISASASVISWA